MHADLIARSRTGDRAAFAGLVGIWADQALQLALQAARDPEEAGDAVARAFTQAYEQLPTLHRSSGFRTWLAMLVLESVGAPPRDERLRAVLEQRGIRGARIADRALASVLGETPRLRLPASFYEDRVEPALVEPAEARHARPAADPEIAWLIATTVGVLMAASGSTMRGVSRIGAHGRGACGWPIASHDVLEVTYRTPTQVGWTVRSAARILPGDVQASYDAVQRADGIGIRLRGVAVPRGIAGRVAAKMAADSRDARHGALAAAWDRLLPTG